jgi:signal transduction histidine kinase/DNA-binding response OmpR family regulator
MSAAAKPQPRGRVLVVEESEGPGDLLAQLAGVGFECASATATATAILQAAAQLRPDAILLPSGSQAAAAALSAIRASPLLREVPVVADGRRGRGGGKGGGGKGGGGAAARRLGVEDVVRSADELGPRLEGAMRARRLAEREAQARLRLETLLEVSQAAASTLELEDILRIGVERIGRVIKTDRCSVVLVEGNSPRSASVVASLEVPDFRPMQIDLARYPEVRRVLETRQPLHIADASRDPLMSEVRELIMPLGVRSFFVLPLLCQGELLGALFLRMAREDGAFGPEEQDFASAVGAALANSVRNARLHAALRRKREDLESAYVDRYRELSEANRRLRDLNKLKDELLAVCSHDLRAPLQVLLGHGRLLLDDGRLDEGQRLSVEAMARQGRKILDLTESLLERGKGEASRMALEPRLLDAAELARDAASELEILARQKGVTLRSECPESLPVVGDALKLHEVLQNLVTNAIQHAESAGTVVVRAQRLRRPDGEVARLVVQDDGRGIPAAELPLVFDRYRHGPKGTGLGLAICKEFVELHGGEIWAETPPGGGAAFVFTVPLAQEPDRAAPGAAPAPASPARRGEEASLPRVLVVEDEPEVAAALCDALRARYRVEVARDGAEGLAKARGLHPDLVVMDVFLPRVDGLDAARALKASSDTADIPVILLTGRQSVADKVRELDLGAVDYVSRPVEPLELLHRVERALRLRAAERELARSQALLRQTGSDPATGLCDRSGLLARMEQEQARARRYERPVTLLALRPEVALSDLARLAARVVREFSRVPDVLAHLGDGLFILVLPESPAEQSAALLARLRPALERETKVAWRAATLDLAAHPGPAAGALDALLETPPR